jgi:hypothetical protein
VSILFTLGAAVLLVGLSVGEFPESMAIGVYVAYSALWVAWIVHGRRRFRA